MRGGPCAGGALAAQIGCAAGLGGGGALAALVVLRSRLRFRAKLDGTLSWWGLIAAADMVRPLNCIVAVSQNMGIGKNGDLPWPLLRNEFKYFQRMTTTSSVEGKQNLVIMGRKTWFSIPEKNRPLKDRINIVLSRELKEPPQGAHFLAKSLDDALKLIEQPELASKVDMVWIVGGSSVYQEAMNQPGHLRLFVTRIMQEFESDTFFPEIDLEKYKLLPEYPGVLSEIQEEKGIKYKFEVYEKKD